MSAQKAADDAIKMMMDPEEECNALRTLLQFTWMAHFIPDNTRTTQLRTAVEKVIRRKTTAVLALNDLRMRGIVTGIDKPLPAASGSAFTIEDFLNGGQDV